MTKKQQAAPAATVDPLLYEPPTVTIDDESFAVRRLMTKDVYPLARILGRGVAVLADRENYSPSQILEVLLYSMTVNEQEVQKLLASLIGVPQKEWDAMPPTAVIDVLAALAGHQDLQDFFGKLHRLMETVPAMQTLSRESSPSSESTADSPEPQTTNS
jgi:hypothetical protein